MPGDRKVGGIGIHDVKSTKNQQRLKKIHMVI